MLVRGVREVFVAVTYSLGIDIGGTFTDIVAYDQETGRIVKAKELTTPDDPSRGVITGIRNLLGAVCIGVPIPEMDRIPWWRDLMPARRHSKTRGLHEGIYCSRQLLSLAHDLMLL